MSTPPRHTARYLTWQARARHVLALLDRRTGHVVRDSPLRHERGDVVWDDAPDASVLGRAADRQERD